MTEEAAETCVRRHFEVLWNPGRLELAGEFFSEDFMNFGGAVTTFIGDIVTAWRTAFPDLHFGVDSMVVVGDLVLCEMSFSGTHLGDYRIVPPLPWALTLPPNGRSFEVKQYHRFRVRDGWIVEHFAVRDDLGMLYQLGHLGAVASASVPAAT